MPAAAGDPNVAAAPPLKIDPPFAGAAVTAPPKMPALLGEAMLTPNTLVAAGNGALAVVAVAAPKTDCSGAAAEPKMLPVLAAPNTLPNADAAVAVPAAGELLAAGGTDPKRLVLKGELAAAAVALPNIEVVDGAVVADVVAVAGAPNEAKMLAPEAAGAGAVREMMMSRHIL